MHLKTRVLDAYANWKRGGETWADGKAQINVLRAALQAAIDAVGFVRVGATR